MEPFELKLHQVTFEESDNALGAQLDFPGQPHSHSQPPLDSFSALVHYDANFEERQGNSADPPTSEDIEQLILARRAKGQQRTSIKSSSSSSSSYINSTSTTTTTTVSSSRGAHQPTPSPSSTSHVHHRLPSSPPDHHHHHQQQQQQQSSLLPWEGLRYAGDADDGQEHFLVNPDDYYLSPAAGSRQKYSAGKVSPEVAAAGLQTLSQVSINTSAVTRHLRKVKVGKGGKRRVAKTTLTSTALTTPTTMPTGSPHPLQSASADPGSSVTRGATAAGGDSAAAEVEVEEPEDSSFETVAEALRLQWSVIGNASVTPASPEEVARIVAEAEKRLRGGANSTGETALPSSVQTSSADPNVSDLPSVGSLSSLSSLSSSTTNDNNGGVTAAEVHRVPEFPESARPPPPPAELIRVPAQSITREVEKSSWFQSRGDKPVAVSSSPSSAGSESGASTRKSTDGSKTVEGVSSTVVSVQGSAGLENAEQNSVSSKEENGLSTFHDAKTRNVVATPYSAVPSGSGVISPPAGPSVVNSPASGLAPPYMSPSSRTASQTPPPSQRANYLQHAKSSSPQQGSIQQQQALQQLFAASSQQRSALDVSPPLPAPFSPQSAQSNPPLLPYPSPQPSSSLSSSSPPQPQPQPPPSMTDETDSNPSSSYPPLPVFSASRAPVPQIGPLFPKKACGGGGGGSALMHAGVASLKSSGVGAGSGAFEELMREKLKLEGQLEILQDEAQSTLQERAELQAQLASLQLRLKSGQHRADDAEKSGLRAELERLRASRVEHEREAMEVQVMLEEKMEEMKAVTEDLYQSQDSVDKLQVRMKELRDDLQAREVTIQALKGKIAELYVEVQTTLQSKMEADSEARTARNDLAALVKAKEWYQEQLSTAHEVRARLQAQLTQLQAQTVSQGSIVERLKMESGRLRQQLRENQERALREKEQLARHLEAIQQDMMEREAAFQEIQRERVMIEDTFNTQVTTVEEEKSRISSLLQLTSDLEQQLELAHAHSKKRQETILRLENQHMDLVKKAALAQETLLEKEQLLEEADQKLIEVESQLDAFTQTIAAKDGELRKLREDKASTEIALKAALQEKESVDKALTVLKDDMGKVEKSFKQMRTELGTRVSELEASQSQQKAVRDELDLVAHELQIKARSVDTLTRSCQEQAALIEQLRAERAGQEQQVALLSQQLQQAQTVTPADTALHQTLQTELHETRARLVEAEQQLQISAEQLQQQQASAPSEQEPAVSEEQLRAALAERDELAKKLQETEAAKLSAEREAQEEREELGAVAANLRSELSDGRSEFERKVAECSERVRQTAEEKRRLETELEMTRRKFELSSVQHRESIDLELQKLMKELETVQLQKQQVEEQLQSLQAEKAAEIAGLHQELARLQQSLQQAAQQLQQLQQKEQDTASINQQLALELERERGRIAGLQQSNGTLKEHMKQLEESLAGRESSLGELRHHLEGGNREREKEQQEYLRRIQELEVSLKKEKEGGRDLRKQIGSKITENRRLLKQHEAGRKESGDLQEEAERRQREAARLREELDEARQKARDRQGELQALQSEKLALETELERARRELSDSRDRNPVLLEQIQSLEWQVSQRSQELQAAREQLSLTEHRQANEVESLRRALQDKQDEVDSLQGELMSARQEKAEQKSRVSELRSVLKASVQHHKLTKKLNSRRKEKGGAGGGGGEGDADADICEEKGTQADLMMGGNGVVVIPPLPFEVEAVEQLLMDTAVTPLDSKPLDNLSSCLSSLKAEISGLQKQMDVHTTTIHTSTLSWRSVESEVRGLQEVVRSIASTIMDDSVPPHHPHHSSHTTTPITTAASESELVEDGDVVHL